MTAFQWVTHEVCTTAEHTHLSLAERGLLTRDVSALRHAAGAMLASTVNANVGFNGSGTVAIAIGRSFGAAAKLASMAHETFLKTLSKDAITAAVRAQSIALRNTAKEMRAALIEQVGQGTYHLPHALFDLTEKDMAEIQSWAISNDLAEDGEG